MGNINEAKTHQFLLRVTEHLAEGAVGLEDPKISAAQHDADRAFLKGFAEPLLAESKRFLGPLEVLRQKSQLTRVQLGASSAQP